MRLRKPSPQHPPHLVLHQLHPTAAAHMHHPCAPQLAASPATPACADHPTAGPGWCARRSLLLMLMGQQMLWVLLLCPAAAGTW